MPFLATGGRHGTATTLGNLQNGLALDLSQLNEVSINKSAATLTVGPGVLLRDIFDPVYQAGFQVREYSNKIFIDIGQLIDHPIRDRRL